MTRIHKLAELGQSIWLDYIRRQYLLSGDFQEQIDAGVTGVTSNPAIFAKAIAGSNDYDQDLERLSQEGKSTVEIYEALAIADIKSAADLLRPVYDRTDGTDGYVSLEVSPALANETGATIAEAQRLFSAVDRPNVMIKVPATQAGIPAVEQLISEGININITLMFSLDHYDVVAEAYIRGLEKYAAAGGDVAKVASVASFFLSRIDTKVDDRLSALIQPEAKQLLGKIAVANAKVTYQRFKETFSGARWRQLAARGARVQRVLWASTSTKNPNYPDTMYVDPLIGPDTVNTLPPETLDAFLDHGTAAHSVTKGVDKAWGQLEQLAQLGIDLDKITEELQEEGVDKFVKPYESLLENIAEKVASLKNKKVAFSALLGDYQELVDAALVEMMDQHIPQRIWDHDHTVWQPSPDEISNRLGWLHLPENMLEEIGRIKTVVTSIKNDGYSQAILLGMGGSSLAPEVFSNIFSHDHDGLDLAVLDSTDPVAVRAFDEAFDPAHTLFIVSTKSGGTVETLSFFKYFYNRVQEAKGQDEAGQHFIAITDEGSALHSLAEELHFREIFLNDPNIGGRYSALSYFGLVPAAFIGVDLARLLTNAKAMTSKDVSLQLGAIIGELAQHGRDKLTLITSPGLANFADWIEQLIAESTGKDGKGILPVVNEALREPQAYSQDRLFVHLCLAKDDTFKTPVAELAAKGHPVVTMNLDGRYDLGGQFFAWEMATAVAGHRIGIHPFNQPNVEAAKVRAKELVKVYQDSGELPTADTEPMNAKALQHFLGQGQAGDYIAVQAYIPATAESDLALGQLRKRLGNIYGLATTLGYGPRFLHSTGQLHKGDRGNGLFIQIISNPDEDIPIPNEAGSDESSIDFGILKVAQALGDAQALADAGRRVITFQIDGDAVPAIRKMTQGLG